MGYVGIIIGIAVILGWSISQTIKSFDRNEELGYKILSVVMIILTSFLLCAFCIGLREEIRYNTLEQYFNGEIEVIKDTNVVRTYKFN